VSFVRNLTIRGAKVYKIKEIFRGDLLEPHKLSYGWMSISINCLYLIKGPWGKSVTIILVSNMDNWDLSGEIEL
jgi:hypothetical protein